ncbi:MAG: hypothetical protein ACKVOW_17200 [Chitinophagaceae bacterium]
MKKFMLCVAATFLLLSFAPVSLSATTLPETASSGLAKVLNPTPSEVLMSRLAEIKSVDKSNLSVSERKALRKETRGIKRDLKHISGGVYVSATAIILIAILLIVLL